jgi:hypothetical protein
VGRANVRYLADRTVRWLNPRSGDPAANRWVRRTGELSSELFRRTAAPKLIDGAGGTNRFEPRPDRVDLRVNSRGRHRSRHEARPEEKQNEAHGEWASQGESATSKLRTRS